MAGEAEGWEIDKFVKYATESPVLIHNCNLDYKSNHIYLVGEQDDAGESEGEPGVEHFMANTFIKNLNILMRKSDAPILVHMKTCGGSWEEGMAIYDIIRACPNLVCILNYTHARSMSSIILQAADKRVMMPHSTFMFHSGTMGYEGTTKQFLNEAKELKKSHDIMVNIYADVVKAKGKLSKWSRKRILAWLEKEMDKTEEVYMTASEAVEHGFADEVFGSDGKYVWKKLLEFDEEEEE